MGKLDTALQVARLRAARFGPYLAVLADGPTGLTMG
ncbi:hypothetical protein ABIE64_000976 [Thalassospira sp. MBR-102]|uniref:Uncharacterized protein n=1 Tax=Thalassospira permensis NBRC 106175 TaxID=1353532 RepID=A0ABR4TTC0_9PROT|nr:hypothetical protein SMB34_12070 [Thalassospira permensis NBRC 106175]